MIRGVVREAASQVLSERARSGEGLRRPLAYSAGVHIIGFIVLLVGPGSWLGGADAEVGNVINIRLGGAAGPGEGGLTPMGGQPVQEVVPLSEARRPQWEQPPADTAPELVVPMDDAPRLEPESEVDTAPDEARGRRLRRGPQLQEGTAMADTGVSGMGVGLSTGGLGGNGAELNLSDFCCPEYLSNMLSMIRQRWDPNQQATGATVVRFTIQEDGVIDGVTVERSSGYLALDQSARRAILLTQQIPRLPSAFTEDSLTVWLTFEYR